MGNYISLREGFALEYWENYFKMQISIYALYNILSNFLMKTPLVILIKYYFYILRVILWSCLTKNVWYSRYIQLSEYLYLPIKTNGPIFPRKPSCKKVLSFHSFCCLIDFLKLTHTKFECANYCFMKTPLTRKYNYSIPFVVYRSFKQNLKIIIGVAFAEIRNWSFPVYPEFVIALMSDILYSFTSYPLTFFPIKFKCDSMCSFRRKS